MLRFLLSIGEEELGDNVADMIAYSTDDNIYPARVRKSLALKTLVSAAD